MKLPDGVKDSNGKPVKGTVIVKSGDATLNEYDVSTHGNTTTCHLVTVTGDILNPVISFGFKAPEELCFDLVGDGILRAAHRSRPGKTYNINLNKIISEVQGAHGRMYLRSGELQVKSRNTNHGELRFPT